METITKENFLSFELKNISQVYSGKRNCCRCGCGGDYIATSFMDKPRSIVNDKLVEQRLNRAKKLLQNNAEYDAGDTWFDVKTGEDRTLTFYIDELKTTQP